MRQSLKPLRRFTQFSAALGLLSISLTGEITIGWLAASWMAWSFGLIADRFPGFLAKVKRLENIAVAGMIAMLFIDFLLFRFSIFIAITHFLLLFQIVKLIGEKTRKDCLQIFLFSFFQILTACTLSVDAWHAGVLLVLIPTATAVLFWNHIEREWELSGTTGDAIVQRRYRRMITGICVAAFPFNILLTMAVFLLFPRLTLNAPLPGFSGRRNGYTDQMNLAQKGSMQQDSSVVLWLSFPKAEERAAWTGYLQGDILSHFDGRQWSASKSRRSRIVAPDPNGIFLLKSHQPGAPLIHQTITLADTSAATIFAIANPLRIIAPLPSLQQNAEGGLHWLSSWRRPLRYETVSEPVPDIDLNPEDLELPAMALTRIRDLGQHIAGTGKPLEQAQNIAQYLQKNYRYSTDFGDRVPENPVDYFLFERRQGSCAHFASAMALMLRLQHIPSRIVAGYLKGEWNEPAQSVVIRERDAHAWVEAYATGKGWVSFDPSPRQAEASLSHRSWLNTAAQYMVYFDLQWNRFVIQYDLYSQIKAFETLKGTSDRLGSAFTHLWMQLQKQFDRPHSQTSSTTENEPSPTTAFPIKKGGIGLLFVCAIGFFLNRNRMSRDTAFRFYQQFLKQMDRAGCPKQDWETGREFAARLLRQKPEHTDLTRQVTNKYYHLRYRKGLL